MPPDDVPGRAAAGPASKARPRPVVLITGASGNLGQAAAQAFREAGAGTVLVDRAADRLPGLFPDLVLAPDHLLLGGVDLADEAQVAAAVGAAVARFGRIDVLVNTVGAWRGGRPVHETPLPEWTFLYEANVLPALLASRAVIPHFLRQQEGRIILVAARSALQAGAGGAAYGMAKSAVLRLTEALSEELKAHGIYVNAVLPSTIDTPQNRSALPGADHSRWVPPAAIADVLLFLASRASRSVHGAAIPVYGLG